MSARLLIIDDEDLFREDLASLMRDEGYDCVTASSGEEGVRLAEQEPPDVVLCDLVMPGTSGLEVLEELAVGCPGTPVIMITAYGKMESAVDAFRRGAADYVLKPVDFEDLSRKVQRTLERRSLEREIHYLRRTVSEAATETRLVGRSAAIETVRGTIAKVAPTDSTVLVTGESGTGKEVVARAVHESSARHEQAFVAVNCAALPHELFESELFGHERGAFTGAVREKPGLFELATGGTLFLDEVSDLPLDLQPKLLRAIEERRVQRVGGTRPVAVDVRIIAATNRVLREEVESGRFREDLFYRLCVVEISLPPLRARRDDIPSLVEHLCHRLNGRLKQRVLGVDTEALRVLMSAPWRGNVRELENVLERSMILTDSEVIGVVDLPTELVGTAAVPEATDDLRSAVRAYEREHIRHVLRAAADNREEAARRLGIDPSTLYRRLKDLDLRTD
jgi:two-component system response regulator PilR (NtrC family)